MSFKPTKSWDKSDQNDPPELPSHVQGLSSNLPIILENFNDRCDNSFDNFKSLDISKFSINSNDFSFEYSN